MFVKIFKMHLFLIFVILVFSSNAFAFSNASKLLSLPDLMKSNAVLSYKEPEQSIWIAATGDIMFHSPQVRTAYDQVSGKYNFESSFTEVKPYLSCVDFTLGNFETTTAGADRGFSGYPAFNAPDETIVALKNAGYDFLSTANNHCLDRGILGIERTIDQMNLNGILHTGTFKSDAVDLPRYAIYDVQGFNIAVLSITYGCNGIENQYSDTLVNQVVNITDKTDIEKILTEIDSKDVDSTIVFAHWGNEYQLTPSTDQRELAEQMVSWGADIILGSHPHVIQASEIMYKDGEPKYVIYSMGNFISNQSRFTLSSSNAKYTENGVIVYLKLMKSNQKTRLASVKHIPTWVMRKDANDQYAYKILPIEKQAFYNESPAISSFTDFAYSATTSIMTPDADF